MTANLMSLLLEKVNGLAGGMSDYSVEWLTRRLLRRWKLWC